MKFYLSSFRFGNATDQLQALAAQHPRIGHINNARDFTGADPVRAASQQKEEIAGLNSFGFAAEALDLRNHWRTEESLALRLQNLDAIWVSGGNTFVLRQAMRLSGFDSLFPQLLARQNFLYAGYSAGICVLAESMRSIEQVDDPGNFPYPEFQTTLWEGLGVFDYMLLPHFDSDHPESKDIDKEIQRCIEKKWLFKALRDGEVLTMEK